MSEKISLPLFDGASVELLSDTVAPPAADALHRFMKLGQADRLAVTPHIHAYYRDMHTHADAARIDERMATPAQPEDIWRHVRPLSITIKTRPVAAGTGGGSAPVVYVLLEAHCDWEDEHGLQLVWKEGNTLVKVGAFDDKPLHADHVPPGAIYHSSYDDTFSTFQAP
ncbi:hypothetical protein [uncultured Roseobacter sp.]|uniref:DUF6985 domain-containing protein n=1 Tax=uncultured Roseobacter sp. TaxID=114847 RepID=UPI00262A0784|nr:hypothetical protein [uncultured Roseobacter sp.]